MDIAGLVARARAGSPRTTAKLISLVENSTYAREIAAATHPLAGTAHTIGVTGAPGVGKSTTVAALVTAYRRLGHRVAVLAVDPSSPFTGGALLGDRVRMQQHATDPDVFIRSMGSRGHLGGLSTATPQAVRVLDASGFEVILIETVGVGQSEVEIATQADTTVVLLAPGMGDSVQASKAGLLEIADILVVNKADHPGTQATVRDLRSSAFDRNGHHIPILTTIATATDPGVDRLVATLQERQASLTSSGELRGRRAQRVRDEVTAIATATLTKKLARLDDQDTLTLLVDHVLSGVYDPYRAADELLSTP